MSSKKSNPEIYHNYVATYHALRYIYNITAVLESFAFLGYKMATHAFILGDMHMGHPLGWLFVPPLGSALGQYNNQPRVYLYRLGTHGLTYIYIIYILLEPNIKDAGGCINLIYFRWE